MIDMQKMCKSMFGSKETGLTMALLSFRPRFMASFHSKLLSSVIFSLVDSESWLWLRELPKTQEIGWFVRSKM